jgi:hypothetical protein
MVLKAIAEVIEAEWVVEGGKTKLVRIPARERKQWQKHVDSLAARIEPELKRLADSVSMPYDGSKSIKAILQRHRSTDPASHSFSDGPAGVEMPAGHCLARLARFLTAERLAAIPYGERIVFATSPTHMQLAFPKLAAEEIRNLARAHEALMEAVEKDERAKPFVSMSDRGEWQLPLSKLELAVSNWAGLSIDLLLTGYNSLGDPMLWAQARLSAKAPPLTDPHIDWQPSLPPLERSYVDLLFARSSMKGMDRLQPPTIDQSIIDSMLDTQHHDPDLRTCGELLVGAADAVGKDLIAMPQGALVNAVYQYLYKPNQPAAKFWTGMATKLEFRMEESRLLGWPRDRFEERMMRLSRPAATQFLSSLLKEGRATVPALAQMALASEWERTYTPLNFAALLAPGDVNSTSESGTWRSLRFFGSLTPAERESLRGGVAVGRLNGISQGLLAEAVFQQRNSTMRLREVGHGEVFTYPVEPTDALPDGLPAGAIVTMVSDTTDVAVPYSEDWSGMPMSPNEIADQLLFAEGAQQPNGVIFDKYRLGKRSNQHVNIRFGKDLFTYFNLYDCVMQVGPPVAVGGFPEALRLDVEECLRRKRLQQPVRSKPPPVS